MENNTNNNRHYVKFFTMIITSMVSMHFLMYTNSYSIIEHFWFSETRLFMTMIMGGSMIIIMLLFMLNMYKNKTLNALILSFGVVLIAGSIWLVRSQKTVTGTDYMEGMIPHHSIAVLTSERAQIEDLRVKELADEILKAQLKEIKEMEWLINDIKKNGVVKTEEEKDKRVVPEFNSDED